MVHKETIKDLKDEVEEYKGYLIRRDEKIKNLEEQLRLLRETNVELDHAKLRGETRIAALLYALNLMHVRSHEMEIELKKLKKFQASSVSLAV